MLDFFQGCHCGSFQVTMIQKVSQQLWILFFPKSLVFFRKNQDLAPHAIMKNLTLSKGVHTPADTMKKALLNHREIKWDSFCRHRSLLFAKGQDKASSTSHHLWCIDLLHICQDLSVEVAQFLLFLPFFAARMHLSRLKTFFCICNFIRHKTLWAWQELVALLEKLPELFYVTWIFGSGFLNQQGDLSFRTIPCWLLLTNLGE